MAIATLEIDLSPGVDGSIGIALVFGAERVVIGDGYATVADAMTALVAAWTTPIPEPPDLSKYDDAVDQLSAVAVRVEEAEDAIRILDGRVIKLEQQPVEIPPPVPTRRPLIAGRQSASVPQRAAVRQPPPPIRRPPPRTNELPEEQRNLPGRVHGQLFGGPSRGRYSGSDGGAVPPPPPDAFPGEEEIG